MARTESGLREPPSWVDDKDTFRMLLDGVRDYAIYLLSPSGEILTWNEGGRSLKGYRADEVIGRNVSLFYLPEEIASGKPARDLEVAAREGRLEDEGWRVRKDGVRFWANVVVTALRDGTGKLRGFAKITRDLSERRAAVATLRQSELRLRALVDSIRDYAVFMLERDGRIATWNPGAELIKGYRAEEVIGKPFTIFYSDEDVRSGKCEEELLVAAAEGRFEGEGWRLRKDGSRFWANVVISAMRDSDGNLLGFSKVTRDLTERKRVQDEQTARAAAERANQIKDEFLAMLGHELRNPLAPIVTALQLMKLREPAKDSKERAIIERQVKHMVRLIDDLLDVARITRGAIELEKRPIDLREIVARAVETVSPLLEQRRHYLDVDMPQREITVEGDEARLVQVLANLLTNAAKYTDPGGHLLVQVRAKGREVVVRVQDDGVGIAPELLPKVFELFVQGTQGSDRSAGGLGIGLALARTLVVQHGGTIEAESAGPGRGSSFTVRLPLSHLGRQPDPAGAGVAVAAFPVAARPQRILVVDDNQDALELVAEVLTALGHQVRTASDGPSALGLLPEFRPQIAVLDIGLPVMDGYELASRLCAEMGDARPRLIALTGYGQSHDRDRSLRAGFDAHLVKPINARALIETIDPIGPIGAIRPTRPIPPLRS